MADEVIIRRLRPWRDLWALAGMQLKVWQFAEETAFAFTIKERLLSLRYALKHLIYSSGAWCAAADGRLLGAAFVDFSALQRRRGLPVQHLCGALSRSGFKLLRGLCTAALFGLGYRFKYDYAVFERRAQRRCAQYTDAAARADGQLMLLMTAREAQGHGIGRRLVAKVRAELKASGGSLGCLYTDSFCNYGFYDAIGLKREADFYETGIFGPGQEDRLQVRFMLYTFTAL